ncbi:hypothetical protein NL676_007316 [Syzygium grande]|nr:hypothetical protein NL676_007316 [Syzygium grande]
MASSAAGKGGLVHGCDGLGEASLAMGALEDQRLWLRNEAGFHGAWKNWRGGTPLAMLDPAIGDTYSMDEVLGCLRIGLICTLEDANQRPTMASIVCELSSVPITLELPQRPAFFPSRTERLMEELESDQSTGRLMPLSTNEMSGHSTR